MSKNYKTEGREKLISFLSSKPDMHFTADEICMEINGSLSCRSSLYRNLNTLCLDGYVRKFKSEGKNMSLYQYIGDACRDHFHLKCISCNNIVHLECDISREMIDHIKEHHGFFIDSGRSILYGYCKECMDRKMKEDIEKHEDEEN